MITNINIPRLAKAPPLNDQLITLLTDLCYVKNVNKKSDIIFVFGSSKSLDKMVNVIENLLMQEIADTIIITGGCSDPLNCPPLNETEAYRIYDLIRPLVPSKMNVIIESTSTNTLENVLYGKKMLNHINIKTITYVCKSYVSRRCNLTLAKHFPNATLFPASFDMDDQGNIQQICKDNWYLSSEGMARVWGEFLRIKCYGELNHIHYHPVADIINKIEKAVLLK